MLAQAEKEAECHHTPEKEPAEGPDRHSPEEEEEAEASGSEG